MSRRTAWALAAAAAVAGLAACTTPALAPAQKPTASIQRTANGVAHISAPDYETLAYGVAYAHAQDNVCQTAQQLVTVRAERARYFGAGTGLLGLRALPNDQVDLFIKAHMDDAALARARAATSVDAQAMERGTVAGYNRFLADNLGRLPAACNNQPWVQPMTLAELYRLTEVSTVQAGIGALADAWLAAKPPVAKAAQSLAEPAPNLADAAAAMREAGLLDSPFGSNAWAFGRDTTGTGRGVLLGNPHFPWVGANRFWQMHLTVPGKLDVMGASLGQTANVQIGFNKDVAWSHTVSTGKRFTLHELTLIEGDPTSYLIDGQPEKMTRQSVSVVVKATDGSTSTKTQTLWRSRFGPVVVVARAGLNWTNKNAYALQDANAGGARGTDVYLAMNQARSVADLQRALRGLGTLWVNTLAVDRQGNAMYADTSVVPDVDAAMLERCAPSAPARALLRGAGLVVLDGSQSACNWRQDPSSAKPGVIPFERLPVAVRSDWLHNSNDSFFYSHPQQTFNNISPLVGDDVMRGRRTRSGLIEVPELVARGPVTLQGVQAQLFENRNLAGRLVMPDLLAACASGAPTEAAKDGCAALRGWNLTSNADARGAALFREFWRTAAGIPGVWRVPADKAQPVATPTGLKMGDAAVAAKVWDALTQAVGKVRAAGFALDAPLGQVQRPANTEEVIALHGGDDSEGVLNNVGDRAAPGITAKGIRIDYGTSYVQTVTFDERGPVAQALLVYGQSTNPASPHATDQLRLYAAKQWPTLPFHTKDVAKARVGEVLRLTRP